MIKSQFFDRRENKFSISDFDIICSHVLGQSGGLKTQIKTLKISRH